MAESWQPNRVTDDVDTPSDFAALLVGWAWIPPTPVDG